jgi:RNA polymerase sigma-70 factor, ECF subfamily
VPEDAYRPGSKADFDRLYQASYQKLYRTLVTILRDPAAAEDCLQEGCLRAFQSWSRWKQDAPAEAWLHRIVLNTAFTHRRRERLREVGELVRRLGRPEPPPDPAEAADSSVLGGALRELPPKQAAAIVLRHLHGYTNREIAVALGVPERTVASRLIAARKALKERLGADFRPEMSTSPAPEVPSST